MGTFSLQKVVRMVEEVVVGWQEVNMVDEAKLCSPIHPTFEALVMQCAVGIVMDPFC